MDVVRELLNHTANVHSARIATDLSTQQLKKSMYVVRVLTHGAEVESANNTGSTPFTTATLKCNMDAFRVLLNHKASVGYPLLNCSIQQSPS